MHYDARRHAFLCMRNPILATRNSRACVCLCVCERERWGEGGGKRDIPYNGFLQRRSANFLPTAVVQLEGCLSIPPPTPTPGAKQRDVHLTFSGERFPAQKMS